MASPTNETNPSEYTESPWVEMLEDGDDGCVGDLFADPDPMDTFVHVFPSDKGDITITLRGHKSENGQMLNSTGLTLWRAAPILCNHLVSYCEDHVRDKTVIELGGGLGLCGILAAALGAKYVCITDGDSESLAGMRENVANNLTVCNNNVCCKQLRWGLKLPEFRAHCGLPSDDGRFDVVMGSDIIYVEDILIPLFESVDQLLRKDDKGIFILAYARRNVKIDKVFDTAHRYGFSWSSPDGEEGCFIFKRLL